MSDQPKQINEIVDKDGRIYWTASRITDQLGISRSTWAAYVSRGQAPQAVYRLEGTRMWDGEEVRAWLAKRPSTPTQK